MIPYKINYQISFLYFLHFLYFNVLYENGQQFTNMAPKHNVQCCKCSCRMQSSCIHFLPKLCSRSYGFCGSLHFCRIQHWWQHGCKKMCCMRYRQRYHNSSFGNCCWHKRTRSGDRCCKHLKQENQHLRIAHRQSCIQRCLQLLW